ncbi:MAG TPA: LapA family protein [Sphingomicrobium sp.]|nr:LapA family protein [Sphingomicrobium sp.]
MQFLKTLFWVVIAVFLAILGNRNWHDVTLNLWGDIQVDIKVPVLILASFLLGWLPMFIVHRTRLWRARQRIESFERQQAVARDRPPAATDDGSPVI